MSIADPIAARAALSAARAVFVPAADGGISIAAERWRAAAHVLQTITARADLDGQPLIGEARRQGQLSLDDAYALVELHRAPEASVLDDTTNRAAISALERAVVTADSSAALSPSSVAPSARLQTTSTATSSDVVGPPPIATSMPAPSRRTAFPMADEPLPMPTRSVFSSAGFILGLAFMVLLGGAFSWYWLSSRTTASDFDDGVAAYDRGAREVARLAFARAAKANPDDARAFVSLGRVSREDGNLSSARRFLDAAIRLSPSNGDANREMGALLLMQGDADVARRFYVRAVQANPSDKLAQGFLACALIRLGRPDEAKRWSERAGAGEWSACVDAHTVPPTAPPATSVSPTRPSP